MDRGVAIDFAGRRLENADAEALGEAEQVDRAMDRRLGRLDGIVLVMDRRGGAGEVVDFVDFDEQREGDVVAHQLEFRVGEEVRDIGLVAGEEIVGANDFMAVVQQSLAQMRAEETGASGHQDALAAAVKSSHRSSPLSLLVAPR